MSSHFSLSNPGDVQPQEYDVTAWWTEARASSQFHGEERGFCD